MNKTILDALCNFAKEKPPEIRNFHICAGVVFKHREIVTLGYPRKKTHPLQAKFNPRPKALYLHAEIDALIRALRTEKLNAKDYSVYVTRVKRPHANSDSFVLGDATPCTGCQSFIHWCGLSKMVHTHT